MSLYFPFFFYTLLILLFLLAPAGLAIPTGIPTRVAKAEIETNVVTVEAKTSKF